MMISILLSFEGTSEEKATASGAVAFFFTYMLSISTPSKTHLASHTLTSFQVFGGSVNCIPWCYVAEILLPYARAKGTAIVISRYAASASNSHPCNVIRMFLAATGLWNFFVVVITPILLNCFAWKGYLAFMCTNLTFVPLVYFCYPDTANLTLEEIDYIFAEPDKGAVTWSLCDAQAARQVRTTRVNGRVLQQLAGKHGRQHCPRLPRRR